GGAVEEREFAADEGTNALFGGGRVEAGRPIDAVAIANGHGGQTEPGGLGGEVRRLRGAAQETERGAGMKFDVGGMAHGRHGMTRKEGTTKHTKYTKAERQDLLHRRAHIRREVPPFQFPGSSGVEAQ